MIRTEGSLCTGYDGIGRGLRLAGLQLESRWHAENEEGPSLVLKHESPDVFNLGDIKGVNWSAVEPVEILTSGDPCQSISIAGRQLGRKDDRFLWPWVREAYRALRPQVIFFENVANIVSHDGGRTMAERFAHLREDGYEVRWTVLGACAVGAPHHRHRWYCMAWRTTGPVPPALRVGGKTAICGAPRTGGRLLLPTPKATDGSNGGPNQRDGSGNYYPPEIANLLPSPAARDGDGRGEGSAEFWAKKRASRPVQGIPLGAEIGLLDGGTWGRFAPAIALWEQITGIPSPSPTEPGIKGGRRLNPELPEWMMGLRPGVLTDRLGRSAALKAAGNGVVPQAAAAAWRVLTEA